MKVEEWANAVATSAVVGLVATQALPPATPARNWWTVFGISAGGCLAAHFKKSPLEANTDTPPAPPVK